MEPLPHISIISSSIRTGRRSHRVALFFKKYVVQNKLATVEILDLKKYNFNLFEERFQFQKTPAAEVSEFVEKVNSSSGIIIVTPEYNGGYPASLKNIIDLLYDEWHRKPIAISTVSSGGFGGSQVITSLQFSLWKMHALIASENFAVSNVHEAFDVTGNASEEKETNHKAKVFINELLWHIKAKAIMQQTNPNLK